MRISLGWCQGGACCSERLFRLCCPFSKLLLSRRFSLCTRNASFSHFLSLAMPLRPNDAGEDSTGWSGCLARTLEEVLTTRGKPRRQRVARRRAPNDTEPGCDKKRRGKLGRLRRAEKEGERI